MPDKLSALSIVLTTFTTFGGVAYTVTDLSSAQLTVNPSFNGSSDINLLDGSNEMLPGQGAEVTLVLDVSDSGLYYNTAMASAYGFDGTSTSDVSTAGTDPDPDGDGDPTNNEQPTEIDLPARADLAIAKTADPETVAAGSQITYTITVSNHGPDTALGVILDDPAPAGRTAPAGRR